MPLLTHDAAAFGAQLDSRERVDRIVDAEMSRDPASEHLRVGGVHDSISRKRCDISAPQADAAVQGCARQHVRIGNTSM